MFNVRLQFLYMSLIDFVLGNATHNITENRYVVNKYTDFKEDLDVLGSRTTDTVEECTALCSQTERCSAARYGVNVQDCELIATSGVLHLVHANDTDRHVIFG
jgi:hypothetical protein